ncbi:MAG: hypothetical protein LBS53_08205, partial [Synergistaceae bacterium]|nr:hypothetical protein [Synergistaceae bacterium]
MGKAIRYVIVAAVIAGAIAALVYYWSVPPAVLRETEETGKAADVLADTNERFDRDVTEHKE